MARFERCPCSGSTLGKLLHAAVLTVLAEGPIHGYLLLERLARLHILRGERPDPAGVYRILRSLEKSGFVSGEWDLSRPGPARRVYRVTDEGRDCLETWLGTLRAYRDAMDELIAMAAATLSTTHGGGETCSTADSHPSPAN